MAASEQFNTVTAEDLYKQWEQETAIYPGADYVIYWHNDSEVATLTPLDENNYRIEYDDDTWDIISSYAIITVQSIQWKEYPYNG